MKKIILVTGCGGVAGKALIRISKLYSKYKFIFTTSDEVDLRDLKKTFKFIKNHKINKIINFAAVSGGIGLSLNHQASMLRDNVLINLNILESSVKLKIEKVILCLTTGMYPEKAKLPLKETDIHNGYPSDTNYGSSFAKRLIDPAIRAYREEFKLNVIGLIPSGIFGPDDNFDPEHAPMLPSVIARMYLAKIKNDKMEIWGTGKPLREYTYCEDIAKIFMWALDNYNEKEVLNIGSTEEKSIKKIVTIIAKHMEFPTKNIFFNTNKKDGIYKKSADNSLFIKKCNFKYLSLDEGIRKTVEWYIDEFNNKKNFDSRNKLKKSLL
jgi:GDP-L-fucose synthase